MELVDLKESLEEPAIRKLLALSIEFPTPMQIRRLCETYKSHDSWQILGCKTNDHFSGCIGIQLKGEGSAHIHHLSVMPEKQNHGIRSRMIDEVCKRFSLTHLTAETEGEGVEIYKRCGFEVKNLGEAYLGIDRYFCEKGQAPEPVNA
ncbi:GNAT family N-acetyltransferase [candidate division WOR-3 bacterium]|nr:GNAT family N-acetyltransferase [candidate division WOR-3 bacterium]